MSANIHRRNPEVIAKPATNATMKIVASLRTHHQTS